MSTKRVVPDDTNPFAISRKNYTNEVTPHNNAIVHLFDEYIGGVTSSSSTRGENRYGRPRANTAGDDAPLDTINILQLFVTSDAMTVLVDENGASVAFTFEHSKP
jgi:hypothetical protein